VLFGVLFGCAGTLVGAKAIGVDRFMTRARATTNIIGNIVGTVVVSHLAGEFDDAQAERVYADYFGPETRFNLRRTKQTT
jgi:Na+/H+-dicarboxylate symporter